MGRARRRFDGEHRDRHVPDVRGQRRDRAVHHRPGPGHDSGESDDTFIPGLTVRGDGFKLGQATLIVRPTSGAPIDLFGLLQFDDLRIGVSELRRHVRSGRHAVARRRQWDHLRLRRRQVPARQAGQRPITDRTDAEATDRRACTDTEAVRATVEFAVGLQASRRTRCKINIGSFLTLTARDFMLDTGAGRDQALVSFASVGAEVNDRRPRDRRRGAQLRVHRRRLVPDADPASASS